jgi:hypothetical protein
VAVSIETALKKDLWAVIIDPTQLELVILNLAAGSTAAARVLHRWRLQIVPAFIPPVP